MKKTLLEAVHLHVPSFLPDPLTVYTLRFVFYRKASLLEGEKNANFTLLSGLWSDLENVFERFSSDPDISSCVCEYVCQYDSTLCGALFLVKPKESESSDSVSE